MPLSAKQLEYINDPHRFKLATGSIRASKTTAEILDYLRWVPHAPRGPLAVIGRTRDTIGRNVLEAMEALDPRAVKWRAGAPTCSIMGRLHHVLGANDAQAADKVMGLTLAGALVDECTLLPKDFFIKLIGRLSTPGARLWGTTNPDTSTHWFHTDILQKIWRGEPGWEDWSVHHFTLDDNPGLTPDYIARTKAAYSGVYFKRYILGLWVAAEGAIYDTWDADRHIVPWAELPPMVAYWVGVDYGTTNPSSAILLGRDTIGRYWLVDEWRHDPEDSTRLTDSQLSHAMRDWLLNTTHHPNQPVVIQGIYVDPAAASFRMQLAVDGIWTQPANNDVADGLKQFSSTLGAGRLHATERCTGFTKEVTGYVWDPKATEKGRDAPVKENDHSMDAARYALMAAEDPGTQLIGGEDLLPVQDPPTSYLRGY